MRNGPSQMRSERCLSAREVFVLHGLGDGSGDPGVEGGSSELEGDGKSHAGAVAGGGLPIGAAADFFEAAGNVLDAVAAADAGGVRAVVGVTAIEIEAASVIGDDEAKGGWLEFEGDAYLGGAGVFDDIVEGLFEGEEDAVTDFGGERRWGKRNGDVEAAADCGGTQELLSEAAEVSDEAVEGVMFGVDGPDDFVHRAGEFAGGAVNLLDIIGDVREGFNLGGNGLA